MIFSLSDCAVTLTGPAGYAGQNFGNSVSVSGSVVVVGAYSGNSVFVYRGCTCASSLTCTDKNRVLLAGPIAYSQFGQSVSVSRNVIVVGAPGANKGAGMAYIYYNGGKTPGK